MASTDLDDIITRQYTNFMGADFRGGEVPYYHFPDLLNVWRKYDDCDAIQTRPGMMKYGTIADLNTIMFYEINGEIEVLVHAGVKLYKWTNYPLEPTLTEMYTGLANTKSRYFVYKDVLYILDGVHYIKYDGTTVSSVEGTTPTTSYYMNPDGSVDLDESTDTDTVYQAVNCLTSKRRNRFVTDGETTVYHLDSKGLDSSVVRIEIQSRETGASTELIENTDFTVDRTTGYITFTTAPAENYFVYVLFSKTVSGYRERILGCTLVCEFDNRIFLSGNPDYPEAIFWCGESDPEYFGDENKLEVGLNLANIKALVSGNNVLWVFKDISQNNASVYYLTPTLNSSYGKYYTPVGGNISLGCVSTAINFNDDIVFFSKSGLEGISSSSMYSEQLLGHRSTFIDSKFINESGYSNVKVAEYEGYLLCLINSKIYLADKRKKVTTTGTGSTEYEWFYWEMPNNITNLFEYRGKLFLTNDSGEIYVLTGTTDDGTDITSYIVTRKDDFGYPSYTKTTNKKGCSITLMNKGNTDITVQAIVDGTEKDEKTISDAKGYAVVKLKEKKFSKIQYKIGSTSPFGIYSMVVQGFVAGYLKR